LLESVPQWPEGLSLRLAGEGDLSEMLRARALELGLGERVQFLGFVKPADLPALTDQAWLGLNLLENRGLSYYYSLANKFFDYVQARVPVLTMDFPEYHALNTEHEVAVLLPDLDPGGIAAAIRQLWEHPEAYERLQNNCSQARQKWTWEQEKAVLIGVWAEALRVG
jgi:glycosyltransferase involved in cell wall biosynthesis